MRSDECIPEIRTTVLESQAGGEASLQEEAGEGGSAATHPFASTSQKGTGSVYIAAYDPLIRCPSIQMRTMTSDALEGTILSEDVPNHKRYALSLPSF